MPFDIDSMSEAELRELHYRITERLRTLHQLRTYGAMISFSIGEKVAFHAHGERIVGTLVRRNVKSVSVVTDDGRRWTVAPTLLERADGWTPPAVRVNVRPVPPERGSLPFPRSGGVG